jgi:integrase
MSIKIDKKNVATRIEKLKRSNVLPINKKYIFDFITDAASRDITTKRLYKYLTVLEKIDELMHLDFNKATKKDIQELVTKINNLKNRHGEIIQDWTKYTYKTVLRRFYKWLKGDDEEYPPEVKWIHPQIKKRNQKLPDELLTMEDVKKIADSTNNLRDRAFVLFLYESGARIGEIMSIRVKNFEDDKFGAKVLIPEGKTGPRSIRIIASAPAISNWLTQHPDRRNKNSLLFCGISNYKKGMSIVYQNFRKMLRKAAEKADVDKPVNPHHWRHSRASELAKKLTEAQLCEYMGWITGSKEAATYVHLSGRDMDKAILALHGLAEEEKDGEKFKPIICPRCGIRNDPAAKFCSGCSLGLDEKSVMEYDRKKEIATKTGFGYLHSSEKTQDAINQALLKELKNLRKELEEIKKV